MAGEIDIQCWKCGTELRRLLLPFSRYEECRLCKADLHVCLACRNYDPSLSDACREDRADFVLDKDKANFCDYFRPNPRPFKGRDNSAAEKAKAELAALFGDEAQEGEGKGDGEGEADSPAESPQSEADRALAELQRLFGDDGNKTDNSADNNTDNKN